MKKLLALILAALMLFSTAACNTTPNSISNSGKNSENAGNNGNTTNNNPNNTNNSQNSSNINVEDIVFSSIYSDGVAIVNLRDEEGKAYVIDKQGNIIFDFQIAEYNTDSTVNYLRFENGLLVYNGKCYDTKGNVTAPESVGATAFVALERGKYIIAEKITSTYDSAKKELGVLDTSFKWILPLKEGYYDLYHSYSDFFWNDVILSTNNTKKAIKPDYSDVVYFSNGTTIAPNDINAESFLKVYENKYILAKGDNNTLGLLSADGEWLLSPTDDFWNTYRDSWSFSVDIRKDFLVCEFSDSYSIPTISDGRFVLEETQERTSGVLYYNILAKTNRFDKPDGFDNVSNDNTNTSEKFDFNSITNHYEHTEFINGKAAVALWNSTVSELYVTVVDENGTFLFEPVKTDITELPSFGSPFYFDGNYIVLANRASCGSGNLNASMTLYTFDVNGKKIAEWKASDNLDTWSCSFQYNDGVIVFWLISGQYSNYYRESRVKYYTFDFKPLFE